MPGNLDLSSVVTGANTLADKANSAITDISNYFFGASEAESDQEKAIRTEAEAKNEGLRATHLIELRKGAARSQVAAAFSTDPNAPNTIIQTMGADIVSKESAIQDNAKRLAAKQSISLFDDTLGWIGAQIDLPGEEAAHETEKAALDVRKKTLGDLIALTTAETSVAVALQSTETEAQLAAAEKVNLANAAEKAATARYQLQKLGLDKTNVMLAANKTQFEAVRDVFQAQATADNLSIARSHLSLAEKNQSINEEMKQIQIDLKTESAEVDKSMQEKLNKVTTTFGMAPLSIKELRLMTGKRKDEIMALMSDNDILSGRMAATPWEARDIADNLHAAVTPGYQARTAKWLDHTLNTANEGVEALQLKSMSPMALRAHMDKKFKPQLDAAQNNIPDEGGLYSPPPLISLGSVPAIAATTLYKEMLPIAQANVRAPTSAQMFYDRAVEDVFSGKMTANKAADEIQTVFSGIGMLNSQTFQYRRAALPDQTTYKTFINTYTATAGGKSQQVELTDFNRILNDITRAVAYKKQISAGGGELGIPQ